MRPVGAFIDTNLLVLFVVGSVDRQAVTGHRRTQKFTEEDYDLLVDMIEQMGNCVFVTPNTLTETSNLLKKRRDARFHDYLQDLIEQSNEVVVPSLKASRNSSFARLGLTDAALLEAVSAKRPLLTVDLDLFDAALAKDAAAAFNFNHYRRIA